MATRRDLYSGEDPFKSDEGLDLLLTYETERMASSLLMRNGPYELVIAPAEFPGKKYRDRYCYEHVLVWWQNTGEVPGPDELIHHKNENKRDNRFENLEKKGRGQHTAEHNEERGETVQVVCGNDRCRRSFPVRRHIHNSRRKNSKCGKLFCNHSCQAIQQQGERRNIPR